MRAFQAVEGAGLARVDFLLDDASGVLYLNELNTMPGFTRISMYPKLWEASGISYSDLVGRLVDLAIEQFADKQKNSTDTLTYSDQQRETGTRCRSANGYGIAHGNADTMAKTKVRQSTPSEEDRTERTVESVSMSRRSANRSVRVNRGGKRSVSTRPPSF